MRLGNPLTCALLSALCLREASAQNFQALLNENADAFIEQVLQTWNSPGGLSVAVVSKDSNGEWRREVKGYGNATVNGIKFTGKTLGAIGSDSKLFTAFAVGLLVHNETLSPRLDWNTKLKEVIPGFDLDDPVAAQGANIIDALSHRTGLPRHDLGTKTNDTFDTFLQKVKHLRPSTEFRETWQYNNHMYNILSYLPTAVLPSKISFERYVKEQMLDPLGMNLTTYSSEFANATGLLAEGMIRQVLPDSNDRGAVLPIPYWLPSGPDGTYWSGAGGIISNAEDMATWLQFLLLRGRDPKTNKIIVPADVVQGVATGITVENGDSGYPELSPVVYGGGQEIGSYQGIGFHAIVTRCPYNEFGLAIITNDQTAGPIMIQIIRYWLMEQAFGLKQVDWTSRYQAILEASVFNPTPRPVNATFPYAEISTLAGQYSNPGYGTAEFCFAGASSNVSTTSTSCQELLADPEVKALGLRSDIPSLVAKWYHPYAAYFVLSHFNGPIFNLTSYAIFPTGQSQNPFYAEQVYGAPLVVGATAEVDKELSGIGLSGIWGAGAGVPEPTGKTARERAEVWYTRTH